MNTIDLRGAIRIALLGLGAVGAGPAFAQEPPVGARVSAEAPVPERTAAAADESADQTATATEGTAGEDTLGEVVVTARQRSAAEAVLQERIDQDVVADLVSAEQIGRVGDSTVSTALRRLPGVTLVGDQFIYIRGLGERYSSTTLNGAFVPSPDLTRNVIPLDLFPAEIVQSLSIQKGYSPDQPAAFGGGNVDIRTRTIPEEFTLGLQIASGWNTESADDGLTYAGGGNDKWGEDDGTRSLPGALASGIQAYRGNIGINGILNELIRAGGNVSQLDAEIANRNLALSLKRNLDVTDKSLSPDVGGELTVGNSWYFGQDDSFRFGFLALGEYERQWRNRERVLRSFAEPTLDVDTTRRTTEQAVITGSLALGLDFAEEQTIGLNLIYLRNTEDDASITTGFNVNFRPESGNQLRNYRLRFEERGLTVVQLTGSHTLGPATRTLLESRGHGWLPLDLLEGLRFNWYWSNARARTDLPSEVTISGIDRIDPATRQVLSTGIRPSRTSADYRFSELDDEVNSSGWRLTRAFEFGNNVLELSGGQDYYEKGRGYTQLQFGLGTTTSGAFLNGTPGTVFSDANVGNPANRFELQTGGIGTESYIAGEIIEAGWIKGDLKLGETWRLSGGVRYEDFSRVSVPVDPLQFDATVGKIRVPLNQLQTLATSDDDYYPALSVTYIRPGFWAENFQLRFGWSQTIARPDLREVADATFIDPLTESRITGNPRLRTSELQNFDIRGEWFFDSGDNFTVSLFYKDIQDPIETIEAAGTEDNTQLGFINAESGEVYGIEFETLKSLGFLTDGGWTEPFFVQGNLTLSDSTLTVGQAAGTDLTSNERRLTQHSPYVANLQLGFDAPNGKHTATLGYAFFGERLFFAGRSGQPDAFEQPFNSVDLTWSWFPIEPMTVRFRAQNILDEKLEIRQGDVTRIEQTIGTSFAVDVSYKF